MRNIILTLILLMLTACGQPEGSRENSLEALADKWVLVNYWAQWCKPCIEEIPELNALDREREDVAVLGVNFDGATGETLAAQEAKLGIAFSTIEDPSAILGITRPAVLPTTLVVAPGGVMVAKLIGPQTLETLEKALSEAAEKATQ